MDFVSIIISCYNSEKTVRQAIESCLQQTYPNLEIIVVDDGSTDNSVEILRGFGAKIRLKETSHSGGNHARNEGLRLARGKYLKFLDSDDLLDPDAISGQVEALEAAGADLCYGDWKFIKVFDNGKEEILPVPPPGQQEDMVLWLLQGNWGPPFVYLYRREFLEKAGSQWREDLTVNQDFHFILSVCLFNPRCTYFASGVGFYRRCSSPSASKVKTPVYVHATQKILGWAESELDKRGKLVEPYIEALCVYYLKLAKMIYGVDRKEFRKIIRKIGSLNPSFVPPKKYYAGLVRYFGYEKIEAVLEIRRKIRAPFVRERF